MAREEVFRQSLHSYKELQQFSSNPHPLKQLPVIFIPEWTMQITAKCHLNLVEDRIKAQSPSSEQGFKQRNPSWWRHQMETFSALLSICAGNSPVTGEFPAQRPVTRSSGVFFDLRLNKRLNKQSWGWWFDTPSRPLWCHSNDPG